VRIRGSILIVDDDPDFRELYRTALRFEGFDVMTASDGIQALHVLETEVPSLVILDLNMPCLDGWSVLHELRAHPETSGTPVIVVTGTDVARTAGRLFACMRKPVTPDQLLPVIEQQLHSRKMLFS
jgi:DNA-binding response OmpR family regulator